MPHAYTEDQLVEQPAIGLFTELGWQVVSAEEELFGAPSPSRPLPVRDGRVVLGRETKGEVVLVGRLRAALEKLNASRLSHDSLSLDAIGAAIDGWTRD